MTRDLQSQLQTWLVVAAFEITDRLRVDADHFGELTARYAALSTKNGDSIV
jgi:hypothetical protein